MTKYKSEFLHHLNARGFIHQGSDLEALDNHLSKAMVTAYIGFDATAPSLHVGNLMGIMMLSWLQKTGHKPITLMGGGTTKIGDPSGKDASRKLIDHDGIQNNIKTIKHAFGQFLQYGDGENDAIMVDNDEWLSKLNYIEFLRDYGRHFSVNRMLSFDSVKLRLEREQNLSFLEFNYMIMQAYDFVELNRTHNVTLQMGGSDQWGNIINGVELGRRSIDKQFYALTCPLITTSSGAKMGKSVDGAMWLNADMLSPYDYWQFWRNTEDADVGRFLKFFTHLPIDEIERLESLQGAEINDAKKILAFEATKLCHGNDAARNAEATAKATFEQGGAGDNLPTIFVSHLELQAGISSSDLFRKTGLVESNGELKRLIEGNGAKINDEIISDINLKITDAYMTRDGYIKLSAGKKRHALVRLDA
jgi:tyrosyl-tRNA synthetase